MQPQHIILMGFKNVGKSTIGEKFAQATKRSFLDLDQEIQKYYECIHNESISCREIMQRHGEDFFRSIEHSTLTNILGSHEPLVIALGGGTPMQETNHELLQKNIIIHITAPKSIVFERIMIHGKPAFFPKGQDAFETFQQLWSEREPVFQKLATITLNNTSSVEDAVDILIQQLS